MVALLLASCGSNAVDLSPEIEEMVKKAEKGFLGNAGGEMMFDAYTNSESH